MDTCKWNQLQKLNIIKTVYENYMYSLEARNHDPLVCVYYYVLSWVATMDASSVQSTYMIFKLFDFISYNNLSPTDRQWIGTGKSADNL